jgi:ADP-heptose:LPS heptosyltransferase
MRFLLCRTDGIGDLMASLPVQGCILEAEPSAKIFWLVRPALAPILEGLPGVSGVLHRPHDDDLEMFMKGSLPLREYKELLRRRRPPDAALERIMWDARPDVLLNLSYRDRKVVEAARRAGVPAIVARPRGWRQFFEATHLVLANNHDPRRHQSQHILDFLRAFRWPVPDSPPMPRLALAQAEIERGRADLAGAPAPRLGLIVKGSTGAAPGSGWWEKMIEASKMAGWNPVALSPAEQSALPPTDARGLMARIRACDAVLGVSTGPTHLAAALGVPTLCLMGRRPLQGPTVWAPLGNRAGALQYEGEEDDAGTGMDRFSPDDVLARLEGLCRGTAW